MAQWSFRSQTPLALLIQSVRLTRTCSLSSRLRHGICSCSRALILNGHSHGVEREEYALLIVKPSSWHGNIASWTLVGPSYLSKSVSMVLLMMTRSIVISTATAIKNERWSKRVNRSVEVTRICVNLCSLRCLEGCHSMYSATISILLRNRVQTEHFPENWSHIHGCKPYAASFEGRRPSRLWLYMLLTRRFGDFESYPGCTV